MKKLNFKTRVYLNYFIINVVLVCLSLIGLAFNETVLPFCVLTCSFIGFICLGSLVVSSNRMNENTGKGTFVLLLIARYVFMALGLVAVALIIKYSMGEVEDKNRYLLVAVAAIPYFTTSLTLLITKPGENDA